MNDIQQLLQKYYTQDGKNQTAYPKKHKQEHTSRKYRNKERQQATQKHKHQILNTLINEANFTLKPYQIQQIRYWIDRHGKELKNLHRQSSNETIILALMLIQYKQNNPKMDIGTMKISRKYKLTNHKFTIIQNRLLFLLMRTTELTYSQSRYHNHELL